MIALDGIVTKCSLVRPKVVRSVHYNPKEETFLSRTYQDQTMTAGGSTNMNVYPQQDEHGNPVSIQKKRLSSATNVYNGVLIYSAANNGVRILQISRSSNDIDPRNARKGACWPVASRC